MESINAPRTIEVGAEVAGLRIGAIKCSYFWRDASYANKQYMWRGKWGCMAGQTREEVENAVASNGDKRFDYIYISPVPDSGVGPEV